MIENFASKWTKQETEILSRNLTNEDYEELCEFLPGRTKASIKAKQKRLVKAQESRMPANIARGVFRYYLDEEAEGQILLKLKAAGHDYTLKDIALTIKANKAEFTDKFNTYCKEHELKPRFKYPTLHQLKSFIELTKTGDEVALQKVITNG